MSYRFNQGCYRSSLNEAWARLINLVRQEAIYKMDEFYISLYPRGEDQGIKSVVKIMLCCISRQVK